jgi:hypothetical protein
MRVSSPIDDVYAIRQDSDVAHDGFGKCRSIRYLLCVAFILIGEVTMLRCGNAQSAFTAINGTITDQSAAQIPDVRIVLSNVDTGIQRIASSGSAGTYSITDLIPGNYSLQVMKDGFATGEMIAIPLQVNQTHYAPISDDIQEFEVQSHNDLAEFGAVTGGIINVCHRIQHKCLPWFCMGVFAK